MDTAIVSILEAGRCFMKRARREFTDEFKQEAVRQVVELGRPASQVARELDLRPEQLRQWRKQFGESGLPLRAESLEEENRRLRRELAVLRQEHEFLGKAAAFFAKGSARGAP
jgi:transposase